MTTKRKNKINRPPVSERIYLLVFFLIFLVYGATLVYPLIWALMNAGKTGIEYIEAPFALPTSYLFQNFVKAFSNLIYNGVSFLEMYWNSIWMSTVQVVASVMSSALVAYVMSKYKFPGKKVLYAIAIFIQVVPIVGSGAAKYKFLAETGLLDNPWLYWLSWLNGFDFNFLVLLGYFNSISWGYAESAFMDGATDFQVFRRIMLPQAKGAVGALMLTTFVSVWDDYSTSLLYMKSYPTAALGIYAFRTESLYLGNSMPLMFAAIILTIVPAIVLYACSQKMILENVSVGGLKG